MPRKTEGYIQKKILEFLEITERSYQKLEYGETHPAGQTLEKLCQAFSEYTLYQIDLHIKAVQSDKTT